MNAYRHRDEYILRYSDCDFKDELSLSALLSLAQESAGNSADELGFGYRVLRERGLAFIIVQTYCELLRPIRLGERVEVETWPLPPRHAICERDYRLFAKGELAAAVASRWCLVGLEDFSLRTPDCLGETHERCPYNPEKSVEAESWKIRGLAGEGREIYRMKVRAGHCDRYLHVNNARYAEFFLDCFSMSELAAHSVKAFQISYCKQAKEGDELVFYRKDCGDGSSVCEALCGGEPFTQFKIYFDQEENI